MQRNMLTLEVGFFVILICDSVIKTRNVYCATSNNQRKVSCTWRCHKAAMHYGRPISAPHHLGSGPCYARKIIASVIVKNQ